MTTTKPPGKRPRTSAKTTAKPGAKPSPKPATAPAAHATRLARGQRRREQTRAVLLEAALKLMAARGMEGVAINEITEAADVGFGSFYNHFESKEAIYKALVDSAFESFADALDVLVKGLDDPAEIIACSVRHTLLRAAREPVWGQFLLREGFSGRVMAHGLGPRLMRDMQLGLARGRFHVADLLVAFIAVGGTVLAAVAAQQQLAGTAIEDSNGNRTLANSLGLSAAELPERTAASLLMILGLKASEAAAVARRPLPQAAPQS